ncbi:hypothetical protein GCM10025857_30040 [Alicyclobacillus contaminans]|nr:hypothetical protein GCM10025857_30040 [Alicyclobacillus contaminans]
MKQGLTTSSSAEAIVKRAMMAAGREVYCVADRSKFGRAALVSYAKPEEITGILTNPSVDAEWVQPLLERGTNIVYADA